MNNTDKLKLWKNVADKSKSEETKRWKLPLVSRSLDAACIQQLLMRRLSLGLRPPCLPSLPPSRQQQAYGYGYSQQHYHDPVAAAAMASAAAAAEAAAKARAADEAAAAEQKRQVCCVCWEHIRVYLGTNFVPGMIREIFAVEP